MNKDRTLSLIRERFVNLTDVGTELVRAERHHNSSILGVFYFDFSQILGTTEFNLPEYLQQNIAKDFYRHEGSIQWNYYLYFVLEKAVFEQVRENGKAAHVEADRTFARKFVSEEELLNKELDKSIAAVVHTATVTKDIAATWMQILNDASLGRICDPSAPYAEIIRDFLSGKTENSQTAAKVSPRPKRAEPGRFIESLRIEKFRPHPSIPIFEFGVVNLIRGPNGSGKTSLLEAMELCICGGIRRQDGTRPDNSRLFIRFQGDDKPRRCPETDLATYRARDHDWYNAYYPIGNQLWQNFNRFNFFDSDTAFRLSSASTQKEINKAIHALFLGELANTLEERMLACKERFEREDRNLAKQVSDHRREVTKALADIEKLKHVKNTQEALLQELRSKASSNGWKKLPSRFTLEELVRLQETVDELSSRLTDYLRQLRWMPTVSLASLKVQTKELMASLKVIMEKQSSAEKAAEVFEKSKENLASAELEMKIFGRLQDYHDEPDAVSLKGCAAAILASQAKVEELKQAAALMRGVNTKVFEETTTSLEAFSQEQRIELAKQRRVVTQRRKNIAELQAKFGAIKALVEQIKGLGRHFCETHPDSKDCPLCGAHYEEVSLLSHIQSLESHSAMDSSLREVTADAAREETKVTTLEKATKNLEQFRQASALILPPNQLASRSLKSIAQTLSLIGEQLDEENSKLQETIAKQRRLRLRGYSEADLEELLLDASGVYEIPNSKLRSSAGLQTLVASRRKRIDALVKAVRDGTKELKDIETDLRRLVKKAVGDVEIDYASVELERRRTLVEEVLAIVHRSNRNLSIPDSEEFSIVRNRLKVFGEAIARIQEALKRVEERDVLEQRLYTSLTEARKSLAQLEPRLTQAKRALEVLTNLLGSDNKEKYLREVVNQHSEKLVTIFCGIHSPNEFKDVLINGDVVLERTTGLRSAVSEISGGQRSALSLSIFLSMNSSVSNQAPWLIFDDPVVHVDDLNTLSFFDMLRDLVLLGNRQVFFTTANTRIADLFTRKFDFLGKSSFKEFPLERSDR